MGEIQSGITDLRQTLASSLRGEQDPVDLARSDFAFYLESVIRDERPDARSEFIRLASFHRRVVNAITDPAKTFVLVEAPRGSGKSSLLNAYLAWSASNNPQLRCILVAKTDPQAQDQLAGVETILRSAEHQRVFGSQIPSAGRFTYRTPWSAQSKTLVRPRPSRFPTFLAVGTRSAVIEGKRSDILCADDILDLGAALSPAESAHVEDWFWRMLLPTRDARGAKTVVLGTPITRSDLYEKIAANMEGKPWFEHIRQPAMFKEGDGWVSYWPEIFPVELLLQKREEDVYAFNSQYQLERMDTTKAFFRKEWLYLIDQAELPENLATYQGIDPGGKNSSGADFLAMATVGQDANGVSYLLDLANIRGDMEQRMSTISTHIQRWNPQVVSIEADATQYTFKEQIEEKLGIGLNAVYSRNVKKEIRIMGMSRHFTSGQVLVAASVNEDSGDLEAIPALQPFVDQWSAYPVAPYDDALDGVCAALSPIASFGTPAATLTVNPGMTDDVEEQGDEEARELQIRWQRMIASPEGAGRRVPLLTH